MTKKSTPPQKNYYKNKYEEVSFLDPKRLQEQEDKIESGEISCNMDDPDECLNCGS
jgi:hypothetical protein